MLKPKVDNNDKFLKSLREIVATGGNRQCFDCGQKGVTYVNMTTGTFICTTCSGILWVNKQLDLHLPSVNLWSHESALRIIYYLLLLRCRISLSVMFPHLEWLGNGANEHNRVETRSSLLHEMKLKFENYFQFMTLWNWVVVSCHTYYVRLFNSINSSHWESEVNSRIKTSSRQSSLVRIVQARDLKVEARLSVSTVTVVEHSSHSRLISTWIK